jgi:hypothetical protein
VGALRKPQFHDLARSIRVLAVDPRASFVFWGHAEGEMRKDGIARVDILNVLKRESVIAEEMHGTIWRQTVRGRDNDGDVITVVIEMNEVEWEIAVVTAWRDGGRRRP